MPGRTVPLVTDQIYHAYNRGIDRRTTFFGRKEYSRGQDSIMFYRFLSPPLRLSYFLALGEKRRDKIIHDLQGGKRLVDILAYCFMPNHFHLVLRQTTENGISRFMSNFQNSYTRYFNTKHQRTGPLFLDQFKAVLVETEEQLLHLIRYVQLNPYTSFVVKTLVELERYEWSSLPEYLGNRSGFCTQDAVWSSFKTKVAYKKFVFDQADYQRRLEEIKHLALDE